MFKGVSVSGLAEPLGEESILNHNDSVVVSHPSGSSSEVRMKTARGGRTRLGKHCGQ